MNQVKQQQTQNSAIQPQKKPKEQLKKNKQSPETIIQPTPKPNQSTAETTVTKTFIGGKQLAYDIIGLRNDFCHRMSLFTEPYSVDNIPVKPLSKDEKLQFITDSTNNNESVKRLKLPLKRQNHKITFMDPAELPSVDYKDFKDKFKM